MKRIHTCSPEVCYYSFLGTLLGCVFYLFIYFGSEDFCLGVELTIDGQVASDKRVFLRLRTVGTEFEELKKIKGGGRLIWETRGRLRLMYLPQEHQFQLLKK